MLRRDDVRAVSHALILSFSYSLKARKGSFAFQVGVYITMTGLSILIYVCIRYDLLALASVIKE